MKSSLPFLLLFLLSFTSFAQKEWPEKSYLAFQLGMAQPIGDFGNKDFYYKESGIAKNGLLIGAEYGSYFYKYFGLSVTFGIRRNALDLSGMQIVARQPRPYVLTKWRTNFLLINALVKYPVLPILAIYGKVSGGVSFNTYPEFSYSTASSATNKDLIKSEAIAYGTGGGLKFLPGKVGITFETFALFTEPVFKCSSLTVKQKMNSLNYSLALNFALN